MNQFSHKADLFDLMSLLLTASVLQFYPFASFISLPLLTSPCCNAFNIKDGLHSHVLFKFIMSDLFKCNECIINFHYKFRILPLFLPLQASFSFQQLSCFILHSLKNSFLPSSFQISLHIQFDSLVHTQSRNQPRTQCKNHWCLVHH